jgi:hypothetical protein
MHPAEQPSVGPTPVSEEGPPTPTLPEGPWFGCFTGDCPHMSQAECDAAIRKEFAEMEVRLDELEALGQPRASSSSDDTAAPNALDRFVEYLIRPEQPNGIGAPVYVEEWLRDNLKSFRTAECAVASPEREERSRG